MTKLSSTEAELKKTLTYKKIVYLHIAEKSSVSIPE